MIRTFLFLLVIGFSFSCIGSDGQYTLIIEGHDWGPAVNKVILPMERKLVSPEGLRFKVEVIRETECEELNPEAAKGESPVNYWMHANMLIMNGKKMAKSTGNYILPEEIFTGQNEHITKAFAPSVARFFMLQAHYRSILDFTNNGLDISNQ